MQKIASHRSHKKAYSDTNCIRLESNQGKSKSERKGQQECILEQRRKQRVLWACRSYAVSTLLTEKYQIDSLISKGTASLVLSGKTRKELIPVVVKVIKTNSLSSQETNHLETEIAIFQKLKQLFRSSKETTVQGRLSNILRPVEVIRDAVNQNVYLVSEHLQGGDLFSKLSSQKGYMMSEAEVLWLLRQILGSLCLLHELGYSHRDVKLENFVFVSNSNHGTFTSVLKLIDFGLCYDKQDKVKEDSGIMIDNAVRFHCSEAVGTLQYVPPEIIRGEEYDPEKVDSWGVGVVAYALISQQLPFDDWEENNVFYKICSLPPSMRSPCWDRISLETKTLISKLLAKSESKRMSCEDALQKVDELLESIGAPHGKEAEQMIQNIISSHEQKLSDGCIEPTVEEATASYTISRHSEPKTDIFTTERHSSLSSEQHVSCQGNLSWHQFLTFFKSSLSVKNSSNEKRSISFDVSTWKASIRTKLKHSSVVSYWRRKYTPHKNAGTGEAKASVREVCIGKDKSREFQRQEDTNTKISHSSKEGYQQQNTASNSSAFLSTCNNNPNSSLYTQPLSVQ
eukprot:jgi/Galph1/2200/GphlegSOOS_G879.1